MTHFAPKGKTTFGFSSVLEIGESFQAILRSMEGILRKGQFYVTR
jgi:hypothetical protein